MNKELLKEVLDALRKIEDYVIHGMIANHDGWYRRVAREIIPQLEAELAKAAHNSAFDFYPKPFEWAELDGLNGQIIVSEVSGYRVVVFSADNGNSYLMADNHHTAIHRGVERMARKEFDAMVDGILLMPNNSIPRVGLWSRIDAIQSAPYVPDWSLKPPSALGFRGLWTSLPDDGCIHTPGEFYIPAPAPSDEELNTKLLAMSREQKIKVLEINGGEG